MKTYEQTFSKGDRLGYAINYAIDGLEQTVKHLPKEATEEEISEAERQAKCYIGTLMTTIKELEDEKPVNMVNIVEQFFRNERAV